jgi:hypothetical protein
MLWRDRAAGGCLRVAVGRRGEDSGMAAHPEVDQSLRHLQVLTRRLRDILMGLPTEAWNGPTNCPPGPCAI